MKPILLTVVGARPQFVKAAALSPAAAEAFTEILVHTGQHYDDGLSGRFFAELTLSPPAVNLGVGSAPHEVQTARMRRGIREAIERFRPAVVFAWGDANSTLAAALAAAEAGVPFAHGEAGLRSGNLRMPEEANRILADHLADRAFAPTPGALTTLAAEGLGARAVFAGDVMLDACRAEETRLDRKAAGRFSVRSRDYVFATVHRAANTDDPARLAGILAGFARAAFPVVFAVHPRTKAALAGAGLAPPPNVILAPPLGRRETLSLAAQALIVLTDSGGLQKEAYFLGVPAATLREETEWPETLDGGWNRLVGCDPEAIAAACAAPWPTAPRDLSRWGDGRTAERIVAGLFDLVAAQSGS